MNLKQVLPTRAVPPNKHAREQIIALMGQFTGNAEYSGLIPFAADRMTSIELMAMQMIPRHVHYSLEFLDGKVTIIHIADTTLVVTVPVMMNDMLKQFHVDGEIQARFSENGSAFIESKTELSVVVSSGAPVKQYAPSANASFIPSGTVGVCVRLMSKGKRSRGRKWGMMPLPLI